jgi:uncharacterized protein (AIM24 family)
MSAVSHMDILVIPVDADYTITGANSQVLNVTLKNGKTVAAEPGAMMFKSTGVKSSVECGSCKRMCAGETMCKAIHTNDGAEDG